MITTLYADSNGVIYDEPFCLAVGRSGHNTFALTPKDLIALPDGAEIMYLPGREATYIKAGKENLIANRSLAKTLPGKLAVAAILPPGYTRTLLPAFRLKKDAPALPLYGYTAAALYKNKIHVAAIKTVSNDKWSPSKYNTPNLKKRIDSLRSRFPRNRLVEHLANCSLSWHCSTAQNLFYHRWEAGIPVSPVCNADCLGCISLQRTDCCPAPQSRITFTPTPEEIAEIGIYHLADSPEPIISFGQGCEGEPSLAADTIALAIGLIRAKTAKGQININTNAGFTDGLKKIVDAGIDSIRVSLISAGHAVFKAYYRAGYSLRDVADSINYAKSRNVHVSLNLLVFPGLTDREEEQEALFDFIKETKVDMVQLRNLNFDPDLLLSYLPPGGAPLGIKQFVDRLKNHFNFSNLKIGSFTEYIK